MAKKASGWSAWKAKRSRGAGGGGAMSFEEFSASFNPTTNTTTRQMSFDAYVQQELGFSVERARQVAIGGAFNSAGGIQTARTAGIQNSARRQLAQAEALRTQYERAFPAQSVTRNINPNSRQGKAKLRAEYKRYLRRLNAGQ